MTVGHGQSFTTDKEPWLSLTLMPTVIRVMCRLVLLILGTETSHRLGQVVDLDWAKAVPIDGEIQTGDSSMEPRTTRAISVGHLKNSALDLAEYSCLALSRRIQRHYRFT